MESGKEAEDSLGDGGKEKNITKLPEEGVGGGQPRSRHQVISPACGGRLGKVLLLGKVC